jgi:hypothetical protein
MTLAVVTAALALPGAAHAQSEVTKPTVATKTPSNVATTSVQFNAAVNARGAQTTYFFQYGPTVLYGTNTPETPIGKGTRAVQVSFGATGLAPATTYHYRVVAINAKGITRGKDRTFKTKREPLGLVLNAAENPLKFNASTTLGGQLTGTGNAGQQVVLQQNPFPYAGFTTVGNALVTAADGTFAFPLIGVQVNTQYRVLMPQKDTVVSPIVSLGVKAAVHTRATPRRVKRGRRARFSGTIAPAADGSPVYVQKLARSGDWVTVASTVARHVDGAKSSYRRRVKLRRGGTFRVVVAVTDGSHVANFGRSIRIHTYR